MKFFNQHKEELNSFKLKCDQFGLTFTLPTSELIQACDRCDESISESVLKQFAILKILEEQGLAESLPNGFSIDTDSTVCLDDATRHVLKLPQPWGGSFDAKIQGLTNNPNFTVSLELVRANGKRISYYETKEPFIVITDRERYLPSPAQWMALKAIKDHESSLNDEYHNLLVIYQLQQAINAECEIHLHHFQFELIDPDEISISGEMTESGDLNLVPYFGTTLDFSDLENRLGQLDKDGKVQSLRVGDIFILLGEKKREAVDEVIRNRTIKKDQLEQFIKNPSAFLDASLVDLDLGFSFRMHGATAFKHAYFGDTDQTGISWFEEAVKQEDTFPPSMIKKLVKSEEELERISSEIRDAMKKGATVFPIGDDIVDISNSEAVEKVLTETFKEIKDRRDNPEDDEEESLEPVVVDVDLNDTEVTFGGDDFQDKLNDVLFEGHLDYSDLARPPLAHQKVGIRWFLGLSEEGLKQKPKNAICGGMLADDMGLGKTFIALVGISEYLRICRQQDVPERPILVVAPKSLLEVWKEEVEKTFKKSPFKDIVTLHGAGLSRYKQVGARAETHLPVDEIRFSLKVGGDFVTDRLDMPNRLILTTYETLRSYQFSLCSIDWGIVVFDEAQHIKNPNAMTTRAAKGLKACFKLVATGTPVENSLADFWCLMDTARPKALGSYQAFRKKFIQPILKATEEEKASVRESTGKELRQTVGALMLRRMKEDQLDGLPQKQVFVGIEGEDASYQYLKSLQKIMSGKQLQRYDGVIDLVAERKRSGQKGVVLGGLAQLKSVSLHPRLYEDGDALQNPTSDSAATASLNESGKLAMLLDVLNRAREDKEKVIIFLINKQLQSHLKIALTKIYGFPVDVINGDTKVTARNAERTRTGLIDIFKKREGFAIIIMSPIAAGTGLTITEANHVIHLERHWNPAKEAQATDRVYRIGQEKDVKVYLPILFHPTMDSFDLNLHRLLSVKTDLKDAVVTPEEVNPDSLFGKTLGSKHSQPERIRGENLNDLNPREFEALCAVLFAKEYHGTGVLTPQSGDNAADAYVVDGNQNVLIECKHKQDGSTYNTKDPITRFDFAKRCYEAQLNRQFDQLALVSNASSFGWSVKRAAKTVGVTLVARNELDKMLKNHLVTQLDIDRKLYAGNTEHHD